MTILVAYLPERSGDAALHLGAELAVGLGTTLTVATVVPRPWPAPSMARVDGEFARWAQESADRTEQEVRTELARLAPDREVSFVRLAHPSTSTALLRAATRAETGPVDVLVLGSTTDSAEGRIVAGTTAARLLHTSPVPLALAPRGYTTADGLAPERLTCAYSGRHGAGDAVVRSAARLAGRLGVPLRVVTFAVRGRTMYPPEVGVTVEDEVLAALTEEAATALTRLVDSGVISPEVERTVVPGASWRDAVDQVSWADGDLLVVGSSPGSAVARVFLGSRASELIRNSPVPVVVTPD